MILRPRHNTKCSPRDEIKITHRQTASYDETLCDEKLKRIFNRQTTYDANACFSIPGVTMGSEKRSIPPDGKINSNRTKCTRACGLSRLLCVWTYCFFDYLRPISIVPYLPCPRKTLKKTSLATSQWLRTTTDRRVMCSRFTSVNIFSSETERCWTDIGPTRPGNRSRATNSVRTGSIRRRTGKTEKLGRTRTTTGKLNCFGFFPSRSRNSLDVRNDLWPNDKRTRNTRQRFWKISINEYSGRCQKYRNQIMSRRNRVSIRDWKHVYD